jgi:transcription elongation factor Elf1
MEEIEKFFRCPYCHQKISMLLDVSLEDTQIYIEDCEVCCRPIQITYAVEGGQIISFAAEGAG